MKYYEAFSHRGFLIPHSEVDHCTIYKVISSFNYKRIGNIFESSIEI